MCKTEERVPMGVKAIQTRFLATDASQDETVGADVFHFSENGEHVLVFTALTGLIASGPQSKAETEISHYNTLHDAGVSGAPIFESQDVTQVNVLVRATNAVATGIAIALILD
jgi:hypothetical protein